MQRGQARFIPGGGLRKQIPPTPSLHTFCGPANVCVCERETHRERKREREKERERKGGR